MRFSPGPRFDRRGNVIPDRRRYEWYIGTDDYEHGMRLRTPRRCSPARFAFRAKSRKPVTR